MKTKRFISLKTKIFLSAGIPALLLGLVVAVSVFYLTKSTFIELIKIDQISSTENEARTTSDLFALSRNLADSLSKIPEVTSLINQSTPIETEQINNLRERFELFNFNNSFSSIYLIKSSGDTLVSTDRSFEGKNYAFRKYFQEAINGKNGIDMVVGATSKKPGFYFSSPVKNDQGLVVGVMVVKLDISAINKQFENKNLGFVNFMLVGADGMILASNLPDREFNNLDSKLLTKSEVEEIKKHYLISEIKSLTYGGAFEEIKKGVKSKLIDIFDILENEHEIISIAKIGEFPYYYVTEDYQIRIIEMANKPAIITAIIQMVGVLIIIIIAYLLIVKFLRPFGKLSIMAEKISQGDFSQTVPLDSNDEVFLLGKSLVTMAEKLKASYDNLNDEVKKKTEELSNKMKDLEVMNEHMVGREIKMIELKKEISDLKAELDKYKKT
jgi:C4-dicarboxylate-specific signal transduction histidine kinase